MSTRTGSSCGWNRIARSSSVVDSRPELEGSELRRLLRVLFAEYVARDLGDRLGAARLRLAGGARSRRG